LRVAGALAAGVRLRVAGALAAGVRLAWAIVAPFGTWARALERYRLQRLQRLGGAQYDRRLR
jgi:hypothetical protein